MGHFLSSLISTSCSFDWSATLAVDQKQNNKRSEVSSPSGASIAPQTCIRSIRKDRNHDAVMRIGGEAPRRRAHSKPRLIDHVQGRVAATSVRHLQLDINTRTNCRISLCVPVNKVVTLLGEGADLPAPRRWSPTAKAQ